MLSADQEWEYFLEGNTLFDLNENKNKNDFIPKVSDLYISTQTKIVYLNHSINLNDVFWKIPIIPYQNQKNGVINISTRLSPLETLNKSREIFIILSLSILLTEINIFPD